MHSVIHNSLHFADFGKVGERGLLRADSHDLRRLHNKALLLASDHIRILLSHYVEDSLQQLTNATFTFDKKT